MYYSTDGTTWTSAGSSFLSSFSANADNNGAATVPIETKGVSSQVLANSLAAGSTLYLAWNYSVTSGTTTSNAQALGVSDIEIVAAGGGGGTTPTISTTGTLTSFSTTAGTASAAQSFTVTGTNLTAAVSVSAPTGFEVSTDNQATFNSSTNIPQGSGAISNAVFVRIAAATSVGSYSGNVTVTSTGGNTNTVAVSGTVEPAGVAPVITGPATNSGTVGVAFSTTITASGIPTSYAISTGALPGGLTLNTNSGVISGTPTESVTNRIVSVTASNSVGNGSPGDLTFNIAKGTQTITNFSALRDLTVGGSPLTLAAGTVSGLTVTYASSNSAVASVSSNTVTAVAPGITAITASQTGDANWNAATSLNQTVKVTGPLLVAWDFNGESSSATSFADVYDSNLDSVNTISRGANATAISAANTFRTAGFNNDGIATTNNDYFQIALSARGGRTLSLSSLEARVAGSSGFLVTSGGLTNGVTNQFAYSTNGSSFTLIGSPLTVTNTFSNLPSVDLSGIPELQNVAAGTTVTLRFYATGQSVGGTWGFVSDATGQYGLAVTGTTAGLPPGTPVILTSVSAVTGLNYTGVGPSDAQEVTVSIADLTGAPGQITVTAPENFEVSTTSATTGFGSTATLDYTDGSTLASSSVWVRLTSGLVNGSYGAALVTLVAGDVSTSFTASGTATVPSLTLSLNPTSVSEDAGAGASTGTVGIPASLTNDLTINLSSSDTAAATVPGSVTVSSGQTNATFAIAAVANRSSGLNQTSTISASAAGYTAASANLTLTNNDPVVTLSTNNLTLYAAFGSTSGAVSYAVSAANVGSNNVQVTAPAYF
jgi:hypothetical protein